MPDSVTVDPATDDIVELDGVSWCVEHEAVWFEGDTRCSDRPSTFYDCVEAPLYRGAPIRPQLEQLPL